MAAFIKFCENARCLRYLLSCVSLVVRVSSVEQILLCPKAKLYGMLVFLCDVCDMITNAGN